MQMLIVQAAPDSLNGKHAESTLRTMAGICSTEVLDLPRDLNMGGADGYMTLMHLAEALQDEEVGQTVSRLSDNKAICLPWLRLHASGSAYTCIVLGGEGQVVPHCVLMLLAAQHRATCQK